VPRYELLHQSKPANRQNKNINEIAEKIPHNLASVTLARYQTITFIMSGSE
jgi:hypothetical protein